MSVILLLLGLLAAAAGFTAIGFGIPINSFSIGNTMIVAGAAGAAGGLVLIGLAAVVRQLERVAARLAQPNRAPLPPTARMGPAGPDPRRHTDAPPRAADPRNMPYRPPEQRPPERRPLPRPPEPAETETRSQPVALQPAPLPSAPPKPSTPLASDPRGPLSWLRTKPRSDAGQEQPPAQAAPALPRDDDAALASPDLAAAERADLPPPRPSDDRPSDSGLFDIDWPAKPGPPADAGKRDRSRGGFFTRMRNEPPPETLSAPSPEPSSAPPPETPSAPLPEAASELPPETDNAPPPASSAPLPVERMPAILKSGVIDGMSYTLYADGSIEAELPQGTLSFASVEALRLHLEKHGG